MQIAWRREGQHVHLAGQLPDGVAVTVLDPADQATIEVRGQWQHTTVAAPADS